MTNPRTIPQIVLDYVALTFPRGIKVTAIQHQVFMVESRDIVKTIIVNPERTMIVNVINTWLK